MSTSAQDVLNEHKVKRVALAAHLGVTPGAITNWVTFPAERVPAIETFTGIPRHLLRPDLWTPPLLTSAESNTSPSPSPSTETAQEG